MRGCSMVFEVNSYDPSSVVLAFGGYPLAGWDSITATRNSQGYVMDRGIRGKHTRHRNSDTSATITVACLQTGESNDILSEIHRWDLQTGLGRISLTLKDLSGTTLIHSEEAFIMGYPEARFSAGFEYRVWTIICMSTEADWTIGGNRQAQSSIYNKITGFIGDSLESLI